MDHYPDSGINVEWAEPPYPAGGAYEDLLNRQNGPAAKPPANPKQIYGDKKLPLGLVPFSFVAYVCIALYEGMSKYGLVNWRAAKVEAMTYVSAQERHVRKWVNGERCDPETKVHHLASAAACLCILIDSELHGSMIDNRPLPCAHTNDAIAELEATLTHLRALYIGRQPKHYHMDDAI